MVLCQLPIKKGPGLGPIIHALTDPEPFYYRAYFTLYIPPTVHQIDPVSVVFPVGITRLTRADTNTEGQRWEFKGRVPVFGPDLLWTHWVGMKVEGSYRSDISTGKITLWEERLPVEVKEIKVSLDPSALHSWMAK
ncbi:MAG: hypothetical protein NTY61_01295 [Candidatus Parcubacteria bacterium]|nr:hypothetical protein [Candidatus Parcubacteria bacterium]